MTSSLLIDTIDGFNSRTTDAQRWKFANETLGKLGVHALNVACFDNQNHTMKWARSGMSCRWLEDYGAEKFSKIDPVLHSALAGDGNMHVVAGSALKSDGRMAYELNHGLYHAGYRHLHSIAVPGANNELRMSVLCSEDPDFDRRLAENRKDFLRISSIVCAMIGPETGFGGSTSLDLTTGLYLLSPRERESLSYLASGLQNLQIAHKLGVSEVTIRKHLISARLKLGASTRENAIAIAIRENLVSL